MFYNFNLIFCENLLLCLNELRLYRLSECEGRECYKEDVCRAELVSAKPEMKFLLAVQ